MQVSRRQFLKLSAALTVLATGLGLDVNAARAEGYRLKISETREVPSICHFCSGGCGVLLSVQGDTLVNLEGDPDHPTNQGTLCPKGAALGQVRGNPRRITRPLYRPAGAADWQEISWEEAMDKIAAKVKTVRDQTWQDEGHRTDAIGVLGSAEIDNEESYLLTKFTHLLGSVYIEHQARV